MTTRECSNPECRTRLSRCDGRGKRRCAKCVRLGIGKKTRKPRKARRESVSLDVLAQEAEILRLNMKRRGL